MAEHHDAKTAGHYRIEWTRELIQRDSWWKGMRQDIPHYVRTCPVCQVMKSENRAKKGLRQAIPLPTQKFEQLTTDLVTDLPESKGYTAVAVFVDRLTKFVKFIPCRKELTAEGYAELFLQHIFRQFGVPRIIISDRDPRFLSNFWQELFCLLETRLNMSTAFHLKTDGQSEVSIWTMENFVRPHIEAHPEQWVDQLPLAEFAANNSMNVATGYSPFFLLYGQNPKVPSSLFPSYWQATNIESVETMLKRMHTALSDASASYKHAQDEMIKTINKQQRDV